MPTDINNDNLLLKSLNTKQLKTYVDGNPGHSLREVRKVIEWVNMVNGIQTLFS
jgi:hypothetical protein